jgi:hypothetical protein
MKARVFIFAITFLFCFNSIGHAVAATKVSAGTNCPKIGATQIYKGKLYTCIKLGKNLFWNNGKKISQNSKNRKSIQATCEIHNFEVRNFPELGISNTDGKIIFAADIFNTSTTDVATDVKIYVQWFDDVGLNYKKILQIPRIYPGQKIEFGDSDLYSYTDKSFPREPNRVELRSTCKSVPLTAKELAAGSFPILSGEAPVTVQKFREENDLIISVSTSFVMTNIFDKDMELSGEIYPGQIAVRIYGVIKDKFGNVLIGYSGFVGEGAQILEPGETTRIDEFLFDFYNVNSDIIDRMAIFKYTIMMD